MIVECRRCEAESTKDIEYTYLCTSLVSIECTHSFESSCQLMIFLTFVHKVDSLGDLLPRDWYTNEESRYLARKRRYSSVGEGNVLKVVRHTCQVGIIQYAISLPEYTYSPSLCYLI